MNVSAVIAGILLAYLALVFWGVLLLARCQGHLREILRESQKYRSYYHYTRTRAIASQHETNVHLLQVRKLLGEIKWQGPPPQDEDDGKD